MNATARRIEIASAITAPLYRAANALFPAVEVATKNRDAAEKALNDIIFAPFVPSDTVGTYTADVDAARAILDAAQAEHDKAETLWKTAVDHADDAYLAAEKAA